jgi:hypothetical protein
MLERHGPQIRNEIAGSDHGCRKRLLIAFFIERQDLEKGAKKGNSPP